MVQDVIEESQLRQANGHANGRPLNGKPRGAEIQESDETDENIFLFVPNLIGKYNTATKQ